MPRVQCLYCLAFQASTRARQLLPNWEEIWGLADQAVVVAGVPGHCTVGARGTGVVVASGGVVTRDGQGRQTAQTSQQLSTFTLLLTVITVSHRLKLTI